MPIGNSYSSSSRLLLISQWPLKDFRNLYVFYFILFFLFIFPFGKLANSTSFWWDGIGVRQTLDFNKTMLVKLGWMVAPWMDEVWVNT